MAARVRILCRCGRGEHLLYRPARSRVLQHARSAHRVVGLAEPPARPVRARPGGGAALPARLGMLAALRPAARRLEPLLCSWSAIWALAAEFVFKRILGRVWPDPTYTGKHLYGFRFLNAGPYWDSFPSGTATVSAAIVATVWIVTPRLRLPSVLLAALLCAGVIVTNGHWLSDVIAGAFLGASIGWMTVLVLRSPVLRDPQPRDTARRNANG